MTLLHKILLFSFFGLPLICDAQLILPREVKMNCDSSVRLTDSTKYIAFSRKDGQEFYSECYYLNGQIKTIWYFDGAPALAYGPSVEWYRNGQVKSFGTLITGLFYGDYFEWYDNGNLKERGSYWIDIQDSIIKLPCERGKLKDAPAAMLCQSQKTGEWKYYKKDGSLEKTETWHHGTLKNTTKN